MGVSNWRRAGGGFGEKEAVGRQAQSGGSSARGSGAGIGVAIAQDVAVAVADKATAVVGGKREKRKRLWDKQDGSLCQTAAAMD